MEVTGNKPGAGLDDSRQLIQVAGLGKQKLVRSRLSDRVPLVYPAAVLYPTPR